MNIGWLAVRLLTVEVFIVVYGVIAAIVTAVEFVAGFSSNLPTAGRRNDVAEESALVRRFIMNSNCARCAESRLCAEHEHERMVDEEFRALTDAIQAIRQAVASLHAEVAATRRTRSDDGSNRRAA